MSLCHFLSFYFFCVLMLAQRLLCKDKVIIQYIYTFVLEDATYVLMSLGHLLYLR